MTKPIKQHLIDPEICIRCYTCEMTCPEQAIEHDDNNVVVKYSVLESTTDMEGNAARLRAIVDTAVGGGVGIRLERVRHRARHPRPVRVR